MATIRSVWGRVYLSGEDQPLDNVHVAQTVRGTVQLSVSFPGVMPHLDSRVTDEVVIELARDQAIQVARSMLAYAFGGKECEETRGCDGHPVWECTEDCHERK